MAIDRNGNALSYNGTSWSPPLSIDSVYIRSVSCQSSRFCMAGDVSGNALKYNGIVVSITANATPSSITVGDSSTLAVVGLPPSATGTVTFTSDATTLCVATLPTTSCSPSPSLPAATYSVTGTYGGGSTYQPGTAPTSLTVPAGAPYWSQWDIARGLTLKPDGASGYVVDGFGGVHSFGGAVPLGVYSYWHGWDIVRAIA